MFRYIIPFFVLFLLIGCQSKSYESNTTFGKLAKVGDLDEEELAPTRTTSSPPPPPVNRKGSKVIKNGFMTFEVDELSIAKSKVDTILKKVDGYFEKEEYQAYGRELRQSLKLRIPNQNFDLVVTQLESDVGKMQSKNVSAKDVTEEYVDLNIRLQNNTAYLKQYQELLTKAKSIKDILEIQEKIRRIEEEIESKKGRLKFLDDQVKYSTLQLELIQYTKDKAHQGPNFLSRIGKAFGRGVDGFLGFIVGLVSIWPFLILVILLFFFRKRIWNTVRRRKA